LTAASGSLYIGSCELTASLPGYRLARVSLSATRGIGQFGGEVLITLHRLAEDEGVTVSMTELKAPGGARKAEEKGAQAMRKRKWQEARTHFTKAVSIYPEYASAWHELGLTLRQLGLDTEARAAWDRAIAADSRFLPPYVQLAGIAVRAGKWREAADIAGRAIALKPTEYPVIYFYHSAALYRMGERELAERSIREAIRFDPNNQVPRAEFLLGVVLANKRDYAGAAQHFKAYLAYVPNAPDAAEVRGYISDAERNAANDP
jgi:tetratricopeptide (TPR) repeat protein